MYSVRVSPRAVAVAIVSFALSTVACAAPAAAPASADEPVIVSPKQIIWSPAPPNLPKGAQVAVLFGDPGKEGPYVMRLSVPSGYKLAPHWHAQTHELTVLSGTIYVGNGDVATPRYARAVGPGGFVRLPANARQYAVTKGKTVVQVQGTGPFDMNYVNPNDDPIKFAKDKTYYFPSQYNLNAPEPVGPDAPSF